MEDPQTQGNFWSVKTEPRTYYNDYKTHFGANSDAVRTAVFSFFGWEGLEIPGGVAVALAHKGPLFAIERVPVAGDIETMIKRVKLAGQESEISYILVRPFEAVHLAIAGHITPQDLAGSLEDANTILTTATFRKRRWPLVISPSATHPYSARNIKGELVAH